MILRQLTLVLLHLLLEEIRAEGLLQNRILHVFLIRKDALNRRLTPSPPFHRRRDTSSGECPCNLMNGTALQKSAVYGLHNFGLFRHDLGHMHLLRG